jgi:hypothetical protein
MIYKPDSLQVMRRLVPVMLLVFAIGPVSTSFHLLAEHMGGHDVLVHPDGSDCPDSEKDSHAPGNSCACSVSHGNAAFLVFDASAPVMESPLQKEIKFLPADDLHPKDVHDRIFHPPRV